MIRFISMFAAVGLVLIGHACSPQPPDPLPTVVPAPAPTGRIDFWVETFNKLREPTRRTVQITLAAISSEGATSYYDPESKDWTTVPRVFSARTNIPYGYQHIVTYTPDIKSISLSVVLLGEKGEYVRCYAKKGNTEIPGTRETRTIVEVGPGGHGAVQVPCLVNT